MDTLILMLFVSSLAAQQVLCQDDVRTGEKISNEGGGQVRAIYSQKSISPHRMMHFGKRPANPSPPTISTPQGYDLYQPSKYPYLLHIELEPGQTLEALPEDTPNRNFVYSYDRPQLQFEFLNPVVNDRVQPLYQQLSNPLAGQRLLKLIRDGDSLNDNDDSGSSAERAQPSSNAPENDQQQASISVNTRSMQSSRTNTMNLPKGFISNILYGRSSPSSMPTFGGYNKKAEPKDNFFMHFGRK